MMQREHIYEPGSHAHSDHLPGNDLVIVQIGIVYHSHNQNSGHAQGDARSFLPSNHIEHLRCQARNRQIYLLQ